MKQTVYADVLLALNFFINYFLMLSVGRMMRLPVSRTRLCLAAIVGAAGALILFCPPLPALAGGLYKLTLTAVMVRTAFPLRRWKAFGRAMLGTVCVTFGFGGLMLALWLLVSPRGMVYRNGVVYFDLSPVFVVGATVLGYTIMAAYSRLMRRMEGRTGSCGALIYGEEGAAAVRLLYDSGNLLTEPFSGDPVIVVRRDAVARILPAHFQTYASFSGSMWEDGVPENFRVIPFSAVGGGGCLPAFRPQRVRISVPGGSRELPPCYVAVSDGLGDDGYDGVIHPSLAQTEL